MFATILAVDLGKFNSVLCSYVRPAAGRPHADTFARQLTTALDGRADESNHARERESVLSMLRG